MSKSTIQSIALISGIRSGILTAYLSHDSLAPVLRNKIKQVDEMLWDLKESLNPTAKEVGKIKTMLNNWGSEMRKDGIIDENNLTIMIAVSQQCCASLLDKVNNRAKVVAKLKEIVAILDDIGAYLHDGVKDKMLIPKFEFADKILSHLYKAVGFELCE